MKVLAIILAGGKRTDLGPLVWDRCKAAVPFFGKYRIIDFVLSNCVNSGIRQINVMVQYKFQSLQRHIQEGWSILSPTLGEYIDVYPPQQKTGQEWYMGTANAIYQNLFTIENENPDYIVVLYGDHIYKMDYRKIIEYHIDKQADITLGVLPYPREKSHLFGCVQVDEEDRIRDFTEKPEHPPSMKGREDLSLIFMGVAVFNTQLLKTAVMADSKLESKHMITGDILPYLIPEKRVMAYYFVDENKQPQYWGFLSSLAEYYESNMRLLSPSHHPLDLYDADWQFRSYQSQSFPTQIINSGYDIGMAINSAIGAGCKIHGTVKNSILGNDVIVEEDVEITNSLIFNHVHVQKGAKIINTIIDKNAVIKENDQIGYHLEDDKQKYFVCENSNLVIVPRSKPQDLHDA